MCRCGKLNAVLHIVGGREDQLGALRDHVVDDLLDREVRRVRRIHAIDGDHLRTELRGDVLAALEVRLRPSSVVAWPHQDHAEREWLVGTITVIIIAARDGQERDRSQQHQQ